MEKTWFITGASRGMGNAIVEAALKNGDSVIAATRKKMGAELMRKQKSGHIFNISSAAGYGAGPVAYHTSKFAVTGFSTTLAFEVAPFGIKVTNVAPGLFRTNFYDKGAMRTEVDVHIEDYDDARCQDDFVEGYAMQILRDVDALREKSSSTDFTN